MGSFGEVPERPIGAVSKTVVEVPSTVGSNPTLSAEKSCKRVDLSLARDRYLFGLVDLPEHQPDKRDFEQTLEEYHRSCRFQPNGQVWLVEDSHPPGWDLEHQVQQR